MKKYRENVNAGGKFHFVNWALWKYEPKIVQQLGKDFSKHGVSDHVRNYVSSWFASEPPSTPTLSTFAYRIGYCFAGMSVRNTNNKMYISGRKTVYRIRNASGIPKVCK
jgi:hypothetical protein